MDFYFKKTRYTAYLYIFYILKYILIWTELDQAALKYRN